MKSYLSLVPISAKVHKRQNRMTLLCIIISVLLVTTVFSLADTMVQMETNRMKKRQGDWHYKVTNITKKEAEQVRNRDDVTSTGWYEVYNYGGEEAYKIEGKKTVIYGVDEEYMMEIIHGLQEGNFPKNDGEIMLTDNVKEALHAKIGDKVELKTPAEKYTYTISGFGEDDPEYYQGQQYLLGCYMTTEAFEKVVNDNGMDYKIEKNADVKSSDVKSSDTKNSDVKENAKNKINHYESIYYIRFKNPSAAANAKSQLIKQYGLSNADVAENIGVMGLSGTSDNETMKNVYGMAGVLFVLILMAGVLMISGSINSNVTQRTKFFGMMRCIGASKKQIIRFVRLEALNWCKTAVPIGVILGTGINWGLCAVLRFRIGGEFSEMPLCSFSVVGILSGVFMGIITVLLAARTPAKRAAKVSPVSAVSGNARNVKATQWNHWGIKRSARQQRIKKSSQQQGIKIPILKIEITMGIKHAVSNKKNWILMTGSFALSIILFLCFSVGMDFARELLPSLRTWQPDCTIVGYGNALTLDRSLVDKMQKIPGVENVYGNIYMSGISATVQTGSGTNNKETDNAGTNRTSTNNTSMNNARTNNIDTSITNKNNTDKNNTGTAIKVNLLSYDNYMLDSAVKSVVKGSLSQIYGNSDKVLTIYNKNNPLKVGDTIEIKGNRLEVACAVSDGLFSDDLIVICSEETFSRIMGEQKYAMISVQLSDHATEQTMEQIRSYATGDQIVSDLRESNKEINATYWATRILGYGFLGILGMITLFYIINSISMSVSARVKQYGAMRAVGMSGKQLTKMIAAESFTYAISGLIAGCLVGLPLSRYLYTFLITRYFGTAWTVPGGLLVVIILFVVCAAAAAVYGPSKRIEKMGIIEVMNQ